MHLFILIVIYLYILTFRDDRTKRQGLPSVNEIQEGEHFFLLELIKANECFLLDTLPLFLQIRFKLRT